MGSPVMMHSTARCCGPEAGCGKTQARVARPPNPAGAFFSVGAAQPGTHRPATFWPGRGAGVCATADIDERKAGAARRRVRIALAVLLYWLALSAMTFGPRPAHALFLVTPAALATARAGCFGPGAGPAPGVDAGVGGPLLPPNERAAAAARFSTARKGIQ